MQFQVPQFIEIEDKIFGPLTFKQFIYAVGALAASFMLYKLLPPFIAIFLILPVLALGFALAFYKVNGRPFVVTLESALKYILGGRLYLWRKKEMAPLKKEQVVPTPSSNPKFQIPKVTQKRLEDLSWELDIHGRIR